MTEQAVNSIDQATPEQLADIIAEIERYRERLVSDTMSTAKRAKIVKAKAMANLEPNLTQIDAQLQALRERQATLTSSN